MVHYLTRNLAQLSATFGDESFSLAATSDYDGPHHHKQRTRLRPLPLVKRMKVNTAQLPGPSRSQDRVFITATAAIVLDGATAFASVELDAGTYADALGRRIAAQLRSDSRTDLAEVVSGAIDAVARRFELRPGHSPSSTITILRTRDHHADLFVLGDSALYYGTDHQATVLVDTRLAELELPESRHYRDRLRDGSGYDNKHRTLLRRLQERQRAWRNIDGGYWIAEADPAAAHHAVTATLNARDSARSSCVIRAAIRSCLMRSPMAASARKSSTGETLFSPSSPLMPRGATPGQGP